jgi:hypothetical protein
MLGCDRDDDDDDGDDDDGDEGAGSGELTFELSTKAIDVEEQLRSTLLHKMCHAAQWLVSLFCGWSHYSTISGKYLLIIAWAVSLFPLLSGVFTEIRLYNS